MSDGPPVDPKEIFELIVKADEKLKYATAENREVRERQARELLVEALEAARRAGNDNLVQQAEIRLSDLGMPPIAGGAPEAPPVRRPTPLDPYPEPRPPEETGGEEAYPPELGPDAIAILEGRTFMFSDPLGDVPAGSIGGLLHDDTRFLSRWELTLNGRSLSLLKSRVVDYYSAAFFLTNPDLPGIRANSLTVRRFRFVGGGVHEQIAVYNPTPAPIRFELRLAVGTDFADLFEVKSTVRDRSAHIDVEHDDRERSLHFHYEVPGFLAETNVRVARSRIVQGIEGTRQAPMHENFGEQQHLSEGALTRWLDEVPRFEADSTRLKNVFDRSVVDLAALRIEGEFDGEPFVLPAAGLPWFMTLFGRDTLITSLQTVAIGPELARGALQLLGALQGTRLDDFRDEEPGKILHEIRQGELTVLGEKPHSPYYGTADSPPSSGSIGTETATGTGTSSTRPDPRRAWATRAGRTRGTACSSRTARSPTCRSRRPRSRGTCTTRSCASRRWPIG